MLPFSVSPSLLAVTVFGLVSYYGVLYYRSPWRKLPPGPKGLPILGNVLQLGDKLWVTFSELRKTYGDILYLNALGQPMIVISSRKIAADILDRRAAAYSDRPPNIVAAEILSGGLALGLSRYTDTWRRMRKAGNEGFSKSVVRSYEHIQHREALVLASGILSRPRDLEAHFKRTAASVTMSIIYDTPPILSEDDPTVRAINEQAEGVTRALKPGTHLVEFFPWMRYLPRSVAKWKREAEDAFERSTYMFENLFNSVTDRLAKGETRASFAATIVENASRNNISKRERAWLAGSMYAAGSDTMSSVLSWLTLALLAHPHTLKSAQRELDTIIGRSRVPTFADLPHLPYIRALVKETLRWITPFPIGAPHRASEDGWYDGHFIPKGSMMIVNAREINRDPDVYGSDADVFNPSRFLGQDGTIEGGLVVPDTKEEGHVTYGFGRRICIGRHAANNALCIDVAVILWAMNIERAVDKQGKSIPLDLENCIVDGVLIRPVPFECKIEPRFPEVTSILEQERELFGH